MFLPCRQNLGHRAHGPAVLWDGSWVVVSLQLWVALPQPCLELGATAASVYFLSHFPSPVSLRLFCLARSMEAGASMWQSCTETCQCCYKLSCTASAPALFAGPAQGHSCEAVELSSAVSCRLPQLQSRLCVNWSCLGSFLEWLALCLWTAGCKNPFCLWRKLVLQSKWAWTPLRPVGDNF